MIALTDIEHVKAMNSSSSQLDIIASFFFAIGYINQRRIKAVTKYQLAINYDVLPFSVSL